MGFFNNQDKIYRAQAMKATPSQPVQEIQMIVEYFDKSEKIVRGIWYEKQEHTGKRQCKKRC
jgi:hypothetical protein